jgi:8-oxo-dGTP pyrophosphatase MutT (NUDIX family)
VSSDDKTRIEPAEKQLEGWLAREKRVELEAEEIQAATVILLRDTPGGLETLMLRRDSKLAFVGGMWVFPGGRVDPEDAAGLAPGDELGAARRAAVRESLEESGLDIDGTELVTWSHWTPPAMSPKRFLTWFFAARAPHGKVEIDDGEIRAHAWMRPAEALARRDANEIELAPPTFVTLHQLARYAVVGDALAAARAWTPERYTTRIAKGPDGMIALWHGDAGYESSNPSAAGARHRLSMAKSGWRYERS